MGLFVSPLGQNGGLEAWLHGPGSVWRSVGTIATLGETCGDGYGFVVGADDPSDGGGDRGGMSARELMNMANALDVPAVAPDGDDAGLALDFSLAQGEICALPGQWLRLPARLAIASLFGQGHIDGQWPVEVRASFDAAGELQSVHVGLPESIEYGDRTREALAGTWGLSGIDLSQHARFGLNLRLYLRVLEDGVQPEGELTLHGRGNPPGDEPESSSSGELLGRLTFGENGG